MLEVNLGSNNNSTSIKKSVNSLEMQHFGKSPSYRFLKGRRVLRVNYMLSLFVKFATYRHLLARSKNT